LNVFSLPEETVSSTSIQCENLALPAKIISYLILPSPFNYLKMPVDLS